MERPFPAYTGPDTYVFVCYAHEDAERVYPDIDQLRQSGVNLWYDEGISAGSNWRAAIGDSLLNAAKVIFYVSPGSLNSDHCNREINLALDEGIEIVPVYLEEVTLTSDLRVGLSRIQSLIHRTDGAHLDALRSAVTETVVRAEETDQRPPAVTGRWMRLSAAIAVSMLLAAGLWFTADSDSGDKTESHERSIVVLPLRNLSPDLLPEYSVDGLTEELIRVLSAVPGLKVSPVTASLYLKGRSVDLAEVGAELDVAYALEGSTRSSGDQISVSIGLVRIADQKTLESFTLTGTAEGTLALHESVAVRAVNELSMIRSPEANYSAASGGTTNEEAYSLYLQATEHYRRDNADDLLKAEVLIRAAVDEDPSFLRAYELYGAILGSASARTGRSQHYFEELLRLKYRMEGALGPEELLEAAPALSALMFHQGDWAGQEALLAARLRNDPDDYLTYRRYGFLLGNAGLIEVALEFNRRAVELNPFDPRSLEQTGDMFRSLGDNEKALAAFEKCRLVSPARFGCFNEIGITLVALGRIDEARAHFGGQLGGQFACLLEISDDCDLSRLDGSITLRGYVMAMQGRMDEAFALLHQAVREHDVFVRQIRWQQPEAADLRKEARYSELLEALRLTDDWQRTLCLRAQALTPVTEIPVVCD